MFRLLLLLLLALLIGVMALVAVAFREWGLPGFLGVMVGIVVCLWLLKRLAGYALKSLFMAPFKAKGAVLSGAQATVHSIEPTEQPVRRYDPSEEEELDEGDEAEPRAQPRWYRMDVTITPTSKATPFQLWEPGELQLVPGPGSEADPDNTLSFEEVRIWQHGTFQDDEAGKYEGSQRLELLIGIPEGADVFRFGYYFEKFGEVRLPKAD
jgi:hypothetical protein